MAHITPAERDILMSLLKEIITREAQKQNITPEDPKELMKMEQCLHEVKTAMYDFLRYLPYEEIKEHQTDLDHVRRPRPSKEVQKAARKAGQEWAKAHLAKKARLNRADGPN